VHTFLRSRLGLIVCSLVAFLLALAQPSAALAPFALGATTEVTDLDEALKIFFNEPIVENVVTDTEFLDAFTLDTNVQYEQSTGGRYIETAQYFQLPGGVGARATGDYIPVPNGPVIQNSRVYLKKLQAVTEMSGEVMKRVRGDMGAYLNWMERALPDIVTRLKDSVDRQLIGLGGGIKARVADAAPDATLGIDTAYGATLNSAALAYAWQLFLEGESLVFSADVDANPLRSTGADRAAIVTNIDQANGILTLDHLPTGCSTTTGSSRATSPATRARMPPWPTRRSWACSGWSMTGPCSPPSRTCSGRATGCGMPSRLMAPRRRSVSTAPSPRTC